MRNRIIPALVLCLANAACDSGTTSDPAASVAQVEVEPDGFLLGVGETVQLTATPRDAAGQPVAGVTIAWSSSDESVATVSASGTVTGVDDGVVTITARVGNRSGSVGGDVAASTLVTAAGGTVTSADGKVTLIVPAGAISQPTKIRIRPSQGLPADDGVVPGSAYRFEPSGTMFDVPVQVTLNYGALPAALADDANYLWLHRFTDGPWTAVPAARVGFSFRDTDRAGSRRVRAGPSVVAPPVRAGVTNRARSPAVAAP